MKKKVLNKIKILNNAKILIIALLTLTILTSCVEQRDEEKLLIMASSFPLYEFAREIAPDEDVRMIVLPGTDVHHYDLKPSDMVLINEADLIIFVGEELEPWLEKVLDLEGKHKNKVLKATDYVKLLKLDDDDHEDDDEHDDEDEHGEFDPHVWLDLDNAVDISRAIAKKLSELKPDQIIVFNENFRSYASELRILEQRYRQELSNCEVKEFIVGHDSFKYLADKYGLKQIPIRGLTADQEPSPRAMVVIIEEAKEHDLRHVFFEELTDPKVSEALAKEIGAETLLLTPAENIPLKDWDKKTFLDVMSENLENLKIGLRCE